MGKNKKIIKRNIISINFTAYDKEKFRLHVDKSIITLAFMLAVYSYNRIALQETSKECRHPKFGLAMFLHSSWI